jgi:hypothetical protein
MGDLTAAEVGLPNLSCLSPENAGAVTSTTSMTQVTAASSANTKGSWTQLIASTTKRATWLLLLFAADPDTNTFVVDIGTGASGSETVLIPNIRVQVNDYNNSVPWANAGFLVPCDIPAGTRIAARCQCSAANDFVYVEAILLEDPEPPSGFPLCLASPALGALNFEAAGADTSNSRGTLVATSSSANTKGSWVQLIASTTYDTVWVVIAFVPQFAPSGWLVDIGTGALGSEAVLIPNIYSPAGYTLRSIGYVALPVKIAAGTRIAARAQCTTAASENMDVSITLVEKK